LAAFQSGGQNHVFLAQEAFVELCLCQICLGQKTEAAKMRTVGANSIPEWKDRYAGMLVQEIARNAAVSGKSWEEVRNWAIQNNCPVPIVYASIGFLQGRLYDMQSN
jgi:hypothetical protein